MIRGMSFIFGVPFIFVVGLVCKQDVDKFGFLHEKWPL